MRRSARLVVPVVLALMTAACYGRPHGRQFRTEIDIPAIHHELARPAGPPPAPRVPAHFDSIGAAVAFIRRHVDVPVKLPVPLPAGARLDPRHPIYLGTGEGDTPKAQLELAFGKGVHLIVQYGTAVFDGCGADSARPVRVGALPALLNAFKGPWSEIIWPATPRHALGRYGLAGNFSGRAIVRMAESMRRVALTPVSAPAGC